MGCDVPGVLMLDIVQRDSLNRMGSGIRGDSVRIVFMSCVSPEKCRSFL